MEEIRVSDSFDNEVDVNLSTKKSITTSIKPKLISTIQKTHNLSISSLETIKKVQSFSLLKTEDSSTLMTQTLTNQQQRNQNPQNLQKSIRKAIQTIKQTTVYEDIPINVIQMFQKAERLSGINHQNKKTIKFVQICDGEQFPLCIERTQWSYFSSFSGTGILVLPDGRKIKGVWAQGTPSGYMTVHYPNQSLYYGELNADLQKHNKGYVYFKNGQKVEGKFYLGRMYGSGRYYNSQGVLQSKRQVNRCLLASSKKA